jgi:thiol-disulfide isomerase/thioredoxin
MPTRRLLPFLAALLVPLAIGLPCRADEVVWRKDYASALQEAREKSLPLVLDFGTDACPWCDKLDATTFRDADVINLLNTRFVSLKIHSARYPELVEHLKIHTFPTLVVADPSGKILNAHAGFLETTPFLEFLRRALAPPAGATPTPAATTTAASPVQGDFQKATQAVTQSEYARAVVLLRNVLKDNGHTDVQAKAAGLLKEIEDLASVQLARLKELEGAGQVQEALSAGRELVRLYDGTTAAAEAQALLPALTTRLEGPARDRLKLAYDMLLQARDDFKTQQYLVCLVRCETIGARFADLSEAGEAAQLVEKITSNPEWMQQVCDTLPDLGGMSFLKMAETKLKQGQPQQAVFFLERILQAFPNTRHAEVAQVRLSQIQGPPQLVSEEKKQ